MNLSHDLVNADSPMTFEEYEMFIAPIRARHERNQRVFGGIFFLLFIAACTALYFEEVSQGLLLGFIATYFLVRSTEASLTMDFLDLQKLNFLVRHAGSSQASASA